MRPQYRGGMLLPYIKVCVSERCAASQPTKPEYQVSFGGVHRFKWRTKLACGSMAATEPAEPPPPPDTGEEITEPPAGSEGGNESELIDLPSYTDHTTRVRLVIALSST